jgi:hypothetical protein
MRVREAYPVLLGVVFAVEFVTEREFSATEGLDESFPHTDPWHILGVVDDGVDVAGKVCLMEFEVTQPVERSPRADGKCCV